MHEFYVLVILFFIVARLIKIESFDLEIALILNLKFLGIKSRACIFRSHSAEHPALSLQYMTRDSHHALQ